MVTSVCGEGLAPKVCVAVPAFGAASRPNGGKPPHHNSQSDSHSHSTNTNTNTNTSDNQISTATKAVTKFIDLYANTV